MGRLIKDSTPEVVFSNHKDSRQWSIVAITRFIFVVVIYSGSYSTPYN